MRERPDIHISFFDTYHYADAITSIARNHGDHLTLWSNFFCDGQHLSLALPYARYSALHTFIGFIIDTLLHDYTVDFDLAYQKTVAKAISDIPEAIADIDPYSLPVEKALRSHGIAFESFVNWLHAREKSFAEAEADDIYEYFQELRLYGPYDQLLEESVREVFYILFANRVFLLDFNTIVARRLENINGPEEFEEEVWSEVSQHFEVGGGLRRAYMPEWVRRAVFFRDRGRCVACHSDLSGVVSLSSEKHFDHMVPLASAGLNDVTNIQLLCATCNLRKADGEAFTTNTYEDWYSMNES